MLVRGDKLKRMFLPALGGGGVLQTLLHTLGLVLFPVMPVMAATGRKDSIQPAISMALALTGFVLFLMYLYQKRKNRRHNCRHAQKSSPIRQLGKTVKPPSGTKRAAGENLPIERPGKEKTNDDDSA
ncbi:MAG TPA: hypothetical protein DHV36_13820 [Desulfobacteraceae bacterium]|nr:hypothetical protein [Desulfobacteraceae bacterium]